MSEVLDQEIRTLQSIYWSERDPEGLAFAPLADALRRQGGIREALDLLKDGTGRHPDYATGHVVTTRLYLEQGLHEEAELAARRVLELDAENLVALSALATILHDRGDSDEAGKMRSAVETADPESPEALAVNHVPAAASGGAVAVEGAGGGQPGVAEADEAGSDLLDLEGLVVVEPEGSPDEPLLDVLTPTSDEPVAAEARDEDLSLALDSLGLEEDTPDTGHADATDDADEDSGLYAVEVDVAIEDVWAVESEPLAVPDPESDEELGEALDALGLAVAPTVEEPAVEDEPVEAVDLGALAPDEPVEAVDLGALAPDEPVEAVDLGALAPDEPVEAVDLGALAPDEPADVMDLGALAPDEPVEAMDLGALAPDEPVDVMDLDALAPDEPVDVMDLSALAPDDPADVMDLAALAPEPDGMGAPEPAPAETVGATSVDAFGLDEPAGVVDLITLAPDEYEEALEGPPPEPEPAVEDPVDLTPEPEPEFASLDELAPDPPTSDHPSLEDDTVVENGEPIYTRTLAELYVKQGFTEKALIVLRYLHAQSPEAEDLARRIAELEGGASASSQESVDLGGAPVGNEEGAETEAEAEDDTEMLARDLADAGEPDPEGHTLFAWSESEVSIPGGVDAPDAASAEEYFERLLGWDTGDAS